MKEQVLKYKKEQVKLLTSQVKDCDALFFSEYRGLTDSQLKELRNTLKKSNGTYKVVKNSLIKRTFSDLKLEFPEEMVKGPTGLVISNDNCPGIASLIYKFSKGNPSLIIKGGFLSGEFITAENVVELSKLPSKDVLIAQFVGGLKSSISRFVMALNSPLMGFMYSLEAIKNKK